MGTHGVRVQTILWVPWPEEGHFFPTYKIADALAGRGKRNMYMGLPTQERLVKHLGYDFYPVLDDVFPSGLGEDPQPAGASGNRTRSLSTRWKAARTKQVSVREFLFGDGIIQALEDIRPDMVIVDSLLPSVGVAAQMLGIPTAVFTASLPQSRDPHVPPLTSGLIPSLDIGGKVRASLAWARHLAIRKAGRKIGALLGVSLDTDRLLRDYGHQLGYPVGKLDSATSFEPMIDALELVASPPDFDFPRPERPGRIFVESLSLNHRPHISFPWEKVVADKPLIVCSLGSQMHYLGESARRLFSLLIEVFHEDRDLQLVLGVGKNRRIEDLPTPPDNVVLAQWIPQIDLLQRARVMITHAGLNGIKESIYFGVPMLLLPFMRDQFGNAARVVYHGLGIQGDLGKVSKPELKAWLNRLLNDVSFVDRMAKFSASFREFESRQPGVRAIDRILTELGDPKAASTRSFSRSIRDRSGRSVGSAVHVELHHR